MFKRYLRHKLIELPALALLLYLGATLYLVTHEEEKVFPGAYPGSPEPFADLPAPFTPITLHTAQGLTLSGFEATPAAASTNTHWCLYFQGQCGRTRWDLPKFQLLEKLDLGILTIDYRGFGQSQGAPSEPALYEDAITAYRYLTEQKQVPPNRILLYGHSLGSGIAINLATQEPIAALIVDGAYTSIPDRAQALYPILPVYWLARNRFDSIHKVASITAPKLFIHALYDKTIPIEDGAKLYAQAAEPKQWLELKGGHEDFQWSAQQPYEQAITQFITQLPPQ